MADKGEFFLGASIDAETGKANAEAEADAQARKELDLMAGTGEFLGTLLGGGKVTESALLWIPSA